LPKARNEIVMRFMSSGFDKLLFLDTDMVFNVVDVFKLINSKHEICALDYRKKSDDKIEYTSELTGREKDGWLQAYSVGAGCMVICRSVIEKMQQYNTGLRYTTDDGNVAFSLFDFLNHQGRYYGEDTTFCRRAIETGFDISVLRDSETGHIGNKEFRGNRHDCTIT
jgi:hypothetical protein